MTTPSSQGAPRQTLETRDAVGLIVGLIIGSGIFKLPQLVAMNSTGEMMFYLMWIAGGVISLIGALCYAELATAYPSAGGDYFFLQRAFGRDISFLFAWARLTVVTSGSIAILAFVFGDYASNLLSLGSQSSAIWAVLAVIGFTAINLVGINQTKGTQNILTILEVGGVVAVIVTGIFLMGGNAQPIAAPPVDPSKGWWVGAPLAILFVLFTFGGWNDSAYISAELKNRRSIVTALIWSIVAVTVLYLLVNFAYVKALGLGGIAKSGTPASDVIRAVFGDAGAKVISAIIAISALTSINATVVVGGRSNYALGRDWPIFGWLGHWDEVRGQPRNALITQAFIALGLIIGSAAWGESFETLVNYTMPVFWFFVMLAGLALFVLRHWEPNVERPYKVPFYPLTPMLFVITCIWLLFSALRYAGGGAWFGVGVIAVGVLLMAVARRMESPR